MKPRKQSKLIGFCLLLFVLFCFVSKREKANIYELDKTKINDFDLIISKGQSVQSNLISLFKLTMEDYSHIGILIKENDRVFVLHSTPDGTKANGIRYDPIQTFLELSRVSDYIVLRYQGISLDVYQKLMGEFSRYKTVQAPFDYDFNNFKNEKIYCSELVWLIFKNAGLFQSNDLNLQKPIYPKYFRTMDKFFTINVKKPLKNL